MSKTKRSELGREIEAGLRDAIAWKRGEIELPVRIVDTMPAARVREIRKAVAKNTRDFETRFGVPARTIEGWEHGRKVDVAAAVLMTVIAKEPAVVEKVVRDYVVAGNGPISAAAKGKADLGR
jgi:putative transcriptional regulator